MSESRSFRLDRRLRAVLSLVPEDRRIIAGLTVEENLQLAQIAEPGGWPLEKVYEHFPRLAERRFVLLPLAEVAPQHSHPVLSQTVSQILAKGKRFDPNRLLPLVAEKGSNRNALETILADQSERLDARKLIRSVD